MRGETDMEMYVQTIAEALDRIQGLIQSDQRADYLDHTPYRAGQSVYVTVKASDAGAIQGTIIGASVAGLILDRVATFQGLYYSGAVLVPWSSIAYVATGRATLDCPWLEAAPEDEPPF